MLLVKSLVVTFLGASLLLVVACGGESESASPSATATGSATVPATGAIVSATRAPESTRVASTATPTSAPTDTPVPPTETPVPPADTPVPPTDTPVPPAAPAAPPPPPSPPAPTATSVPAPASPQSLFVDAVNLKFSPAVLSASAGATVTLTMNNQDNIVPHNVALNGLGTTATCAAPCTASVSFTAPSPGSYGFICTVHPYMTGTLVVQ